MENAIDTGVLVKDVKWRTECLDRMMEVAEWNKAIKRSFWKSMKCYNHLMDETESCLLLIRIYLDAIGSEASSATLRQRPLCRSPRPGKILMTSPCARSPGSGPSFFWGLEEDEECFEAVARYLRHIQTFLISMFFDTEQIENKDAIFRSASPYGFVDFAKSHLTSTSTYPPYLLPPSKDPIEFLPPTILHPEDRETSEEEEAEKKEPSPHSSPDPGRWRRTRIKNRPRPLLSLGDGNAVMDVLFPMRFDGGKRTGSRRSSMKRKQKNNDVSSKRSVKSSDEKSLKSDDEKSMRRSLKYDNEKYTKRRLKNRDETSNDQETTEDDNSTPPIRSQRRSLALSKMQSILAWQNDDILKEEPRDRSVSPTHRSRQTTRSLSPQLRQDPKNRWKTIPFSDVLDEKIMRKFRPKWTSIPFTEPPGFSIEERGEDRRSKFFERGGKCKKSGERGSSERRKEEQRKPRRTKSKERHELVSSPIGDPIVGDRSSQIPIFIIPREAFRTLPSSPIRSRDKETQSALIPGYNTHRGPNPCDREPVEELTKRKKRHRSSARRKNKMIVMFDDDLAKIGHAPREEESRSCVIYGVVEKGEKDKTHDRHDEPMNRNKDHSNFCTTTKDQVILQTIRSPKPRTERDESFFMFFPIPGSSEDRVQLWEEKWARPGTVPAVPKWKLLGHNKSRVKDNVEEQELYEDEGIFAEEVAKEERGDVETRDLTSRDITWRDGGYENLDPYQPPSRSTSPKPHRNVPILHVTIQSLHDPSNISLPTTTSLKITPQEEGLPTLTTPFETPTPTSSHALTRLKRADRTLQKCTLAFLMLFTELSWLSKRYDAPAASMVVDREIFAKLDAWPCVHILVTYLHGPIHPFHGPPPKWKSRADMRTLGTDKSVGSDHRGWLKGETLVSLFRATEILEDLERLDPKKLIVYEEEFGYLLSNPLISGTALDDPRPLMHATVAKVKRLANRFGGGRVRAWDGEMGSVER
ncbi:hypothetical protein HDU67_007101 [Dinochytrium kinnereticum]|nr:hypothetical protein HDU67_007101 [Dinochytrium kinnereticum]